jgi:hypothetical protein
MSAFEGEADVTTAECHFCFKTQAVWKRFSYPKTARNRARWTSTRPSEPIFAASGLESIRAQPQAMLTT